MLSPSATLNGRRRLDLRLRQKTAGVAEDSVRRLICDVVVLDRIHRDLAMYRILFIPWFHLHDLPEHRVVSGARSPASLER